LTSTAIAVAFGTSWRTSSSRFGPISMWMHRRWRG
jgi:hypothetical protein